MQSGKYIHKTDDKQKGGKITVFMDNTQTNSVWEKLHAAGKT